MMNDNMEEEIKFCDNCGLITLQDDVKCKGCEKKLRVIK